MLLTSLLTLKMYLITQKSWQIKTVILNLLDSLYSLELMSNVLEIVDSLQSKLDKLLSKYELLQIENQQLLEKSDRLIQEIDSQKNSIQALETNYESLRVANAMVGSKEDKHVTKLKINTLIREIDKCIAQLAD